MKLNCYFCDRRFKRKFWNEHENSLRHPKNFQSQMPNVGEKVGVNNNYRLFDIGKTRSSISNTTHDNTKNSRKKIIQRNERNPFSLPSNSELKTKLIPAKLQFIDAKISVITKTKET